MNDSEEMADKCLFQKALDSLDALPREERDQPNTSVMRARLLIQLGRFNEADQLLSPMLSRDYPSRTLGQLFLLRGLVRGGQLNRLQESLADLDKAFENQADPAIVANARGVALVEAGEYIRGRAQFLEALRLEPNSASAMHNLGCVEAAEGHLAASSELLHRAWARGHRNPQELRSDPRLQPLRHAHLLDDLLSAPASQSRCEGY